MVAAFRQGLSEVGFAPYTDNSGQGFRATWGDRSASGRRLVLRRPDRSSARIVCRHEHASYRRAAPILSLAAHVAHAL